MERAMSSRGTIGRLALRAGARIAVAALAPAVAIARPTGEQVAAGSAAVTREGPLTRIDTGTPQTVINWSGGFDIGAHEIVQINQPSPISNTLNYDLSTDPSRIDGQLLSNGGVWIINPVGVFFGDRAVVDVGRLVAGAGEGDPARVPARAPPLTPPPRRLPAAPPPPIPPPH